MTYPDLTSVTYDYQAGFHALTTVTNERGYSTTYAYDASGHNTGATDALGNRTTNVYDASTGLLQNAIDARGNTSTMAYDAARRLTATTNAKNETATYTYDAHGNGETTTDALGRVTMAVNDVMGRTTASIDALNGRATVAYDAASGLGLWNKDALGTVGTVIYDPFKRGLATQTVQGYLTGVQSSGLATYDELGRAKASRTATGWTSETHFDAVGSALSGTDALGHRTGYTETDALGRTVYSRDSMGRLTAYAYDQRDRVETTTDELGRVSTSVYDEAGNNTVQIDSLGRRTTAVFDSLNRQTVTIDPLGRRTTTTFDAAGNVATSSDHMGRVTSYAYDELNRATRTTVAVGTAAQAMTSMAYDAVGNLIGTTDGLGKTTAYSYDDLNRQAVVTDPLSQRTTTTYDAVGGVIAVTDALNKTATYSYDALHRQVGTIDRVGNRTTSVLDAAGGSAAALDGLGKLTVAATDANGRSIGSIDALGGFGYTLYAGDGKPRAVADAAGNETRYAYDPAGRPLSLTDSAGNTSQLAYDPAGRVSQRTDRTGRVMAYSYDGADRNTGVAWRTAAGVTVNLLTYTYDDTDKILTAADSAGTISYSYDDQDRVASRADAFGHVLTYAYDANDRVTARQDSFGGVLTTVYDDAGRPTSTRHGGASQTEVRIDFAYTDRNELASVGRFADVSGTAPVGTTTWQYDDGRRPTTAVTKDSAGTTLSSYAYAYDAADRVTTHTYSSTLGTTTYSGTRTYGYDTNDRVAADGGTAYTYDATGNRTMAGYATGAANRMTNDGVFTYTYDGNGNTTQKSKGSGLETWFYTWDAADRLTNVTKTSNGSTATLSVTYTYDIEGHRIAEDKWVTGAGATATRFAWDGANAWAEADGSGALQVRHVYGGAIARPLARVVTSGASAGRAFYVTDALGSVRDVIDGTGTPRYHAEYNAFGGVSEFGMSFASRLKYASRAFDTDAGIYIDGYRHLQPDTGRWLGENSLEYRLPTVNRYTFVVAKAAPPVPKPIGVFILGRLREPTDPSVINQIYDDYSKLYDAKRVKTSTHLWTTFDPFQVLTSGYAPNGVEPLMPWLRQKLDAAKIASGVYPKLDMFGYSRGAASCILVAQLLRRLGYTDARIRFIGLIDPIHARMVVQSGMSYTTSTRTAEIPLAAGKGTLQFTQTGLVLPKIFDAYFLAIRALPKASTYLMKLPDNIVFTWAAGGGYEYLKPTIENPTWVHEEMDTTNGDVTKAMRTATKAATGV